jgi:hypothetical protein
MAVAHRQPTGDAFGEAAEISAHALSDRFQCLDPRGPRMSMDADAFGQAMIHRDAHGSRPLARECRCQIGAHMVSMVSGMMVPSWVRGPRGEPTRPAANRSFARINRSTRRNDVRTPCQRNRAHTLRWHSP